MLRPAHLLLALLCTGVQAGELDGHYRSSIDGQPSELILQQQGDKVEGRYVENQSLQLALRGNYDGQLLRAEISDPKSGVLLANMHASYANAQLNTRITARDPRNGEVLERQALFRRATSTPAGAPATQQAQEPTLVGTWLHKQVSNSDESKPAVFTALLTLRLEADGRVTQWRRELGEHDASNVDAPGQVQYSGHWRSEGGMLLVRLAGASDYQPAAYYRFSGGYLLTQSNSGKMVWQRR